MYCNLKNRNYNLICTNELPGMADEWLLDYPELTDPESEHYNEKFLEALQNFDQTLIKTIGEINSKELLSLEDRRYELLEIVIDALDDHLCFKVPDFDDDCTRLGIEHQEVIKRNTKANAAMNLLRREDDDFWPSYDTKQGTAGHHWEETDFAFFIKNLSLPENAADLAHTGIKENAATLTDIDQKINSYCEEHRILDQLNLLRENRFELLKYLSLLPHFARREIHVSDDNPFFIQKKRRYCHPSEFIPEYYIREREQKEMLMFSWNDFDMDQFFEFAKKSIEKVFNDEEIDSSEIGEIKGYWYDFRTLYDDCVKAPEWEEFCEIDKEWWQTSEKLLLAVAHERFPFGADYKRQMELHKASGKQGAYDDLSSVLSENFFAFFRRGESFYEQEIMKILEKWDTPKQREHLELFNIEELFDSLKVINERCESLFQKIELVLDKKDLGDLRYYRRTLTTIFNNTLE